MNPHKPGEPADIAALARALAGDILGDDGLPDPALAAILARHLARPDLAELADALDGPTARARRRALRRILDEPAFLAALIQTPTGPLVESLPGRVY